MKTIKIALLVVAAVNCSTTYAQNEELKELIKKSFTFNTKVQEYEQSTKISENRIEISKLSLLPSFTGNGIYNYINQVSTIDGNKIQPNDVFNFNVAVNYVAFDFGLARANINRSKQELQASKNNTEAIKLQLAYQAANLYYGIVYTKNAIAIQDSVLKFLTDNLTDINTRVKFGDALQYDALTIQSFIDQELNRKVDLENNLHKQLNLLEYITGVKVYNGKEFDFIIIDDNLETITNEAKKQNSDFIIQNDRIKLAEADRKIASKLGRPTLSLSAGSGYRNGFTPEINNLKLTTIVGVNLSVPIYNGGRTAKQIKLSDNAVELQKISLKTLENTINKDFKQALLDCSTAKERLQNTEGQIRQSQAAVALAQTRFKGGVGTNLELTNASTNLQKAELYKIQFQYQLCLAQLEIARLKGLRFWLD